MDVRISPLREEHLDQIMIVEENAFSTPWSKDAFRGELTNELAHYWVAEIEAKVVGYFGIWYIFNEGHITNVAVHSDYRGEGIGKKLLEYGLSQALENGIDAVTLEVRPSNRVAIELYTNFGFEAVGKRKDYYTKPVEDGFVFWLELREAKERNAKEFFSVL